MDMPCHACRGVAVPDAIRKNHACEVVATGEHRQKIAASVAAGRHSDDIAFQSRQIQRAVRFFIPSPQLHAAERPHRRSGAIKLLGFNLLELHIILMPEELAWVQHRPLKRSRVPCPGCVNCLGRNGLKSPAASKSLTLSLYLPYDTRMRLLLVEDDARIARFVAKGLREQAYAVDVSSGADDYLTKPFEFRELLARLRALLRRSGELRPAKISVADLVLDTGAQSVSRAGRSVALTAKEYALLEYLARNAGRVVGRAEIAEHVWDETFDPFSNLIEVYVNRVRRKIDLDSSKPLLHTRRGAGYLFGPLSDSDAADAADESALPRQRIKAVYPARKSHA